MNLRAKTHMNTQTHTTNPNQKPNQKPNRNESNHPDLPETKVEEKPVS